MKLTATEQDFLILILDVYFHHAESSISEIILNEAKDASVPVKSSQELEALLDNAIINEQIVLKFAKAYKGRKDSAAIKYNALKILKELQRIRRFQQIAKVINDNG